MVKTLPPMQATRETLGQSLGREDPLKEEMVNNSSILAWKIPWAEKPGDCSPSSHKELVWT